ncbi:hypothetical protein ACFPN7_25990 [Amycolatopsis halotolerans]|uniref:hypothetical protein n=1 Tax=Amycolatopsis halotolerans TaxID=330083 RepID=UPI00360E5E72
MSAVAWPGRTVAGVPDVGGRPAGGGCVRRRSDAPSGLVEAERVLSAVRLPVTAGMCGGRSGRAAALGADGWPR